MVDMSGDLRERTYIKYQDVIQFNPIVHSVKGKEPTIDFDNARISKLEPARVDKTKVRVLLEGERSRGMAYAYRKDGVKEDVFAKLVSDKRVLGKTLNEVLNLEVSF